MKSGVTSAVHQRMLDAAATLQLHRSATVAALERDGRARGARVVAVGPNLGEQLARRASAWRQALSVRCGTTADDLRLSLPRHRSAVAAGLDLTSVFDWDATSPGARAMLVDEPLGSYYFARAPVQLTVVDGVEALLHGPVVDGHDSVMAVRHPTVLEAATRYWRAVMAGARPVGPSPGVRADEQDGDFTERQARVLDLMLEDLTDQQVADCLGVSLRTVRYEAASILRSLGARSRFGAGFRLGLRGPGPRGTRTGGSG